MAILSTAEALCSLCGGLFPFNCFLLLFHLVTLFSLFATATNFKEVTHKQLSAVCKIDLGLLLTIISFYGFVILAFVITLVKMTWFIAVSTLDLIFCIKKLLYMNRAVKRHVFIIGQSSGKGTDEHLVGSYNTSSFDEKVVKLFVARPIAKSRQ
ncbi:hypothetical protein BDF20DRAFT_845598 [Mycotypha africana]|uniref:uncharacterized protein n=1 Tax=Mycotypha africana TaxID=64632 RepID=UPI0023006CCF|nr:uncharacterized protein BDF20DRAFT_845598 [Mycotypha africana]KAI8991620.1 hypothetical protein BDF20DRAFT_845598 [Mycotypha africana]